MFIMSEHSIKRGIALEGGGAKGSYQLGVMQAIHEIGISYEGVVGASIGAINGAMIAMQDLKLMEDVWLGTQVGDIINGDKELLEKLVKLDFKEDVDKIRQLVIDTIKQGGLDVSPYRAYLRRIDDEERIRASNIEYGLVTLSLTDLKPIERFVDDIETGMLIDYIIASANFPAFKLEKINNKIFLDGGFFDNLPVNMLIDRGYDEVIAIRIMGMGRIRKVKKEDAAKVITIMPSEDLGKTLEIDPKRAAYNIKLGYYDAYRHFKKLKGKRYYITEIWTEDDVFKRLANLPEHLTTQLMNTMDVQQPPRRFIFETFLPTLCDVLKLSREATYGDIFLAFYEALAEEAGVDRLKFYTLETLIEAVNAHYTKEALELTRTLDGLSIHLLNFIRNTGIALIWSKQRRQFLEYILYLLLQSDVSAERQIIQKGNQ
jgi:NTE family protein